MAVSGWFLGRMATVSDGLCSIPSKRLKLEIMEPTSAENPQAQPNLNTDKEDTTFKTTNDVCPSPKSASDADATVGWSCGETNDDADDASSTFSNVSDLSGLSDMSGQQWKPIPSALIERAKLSGTDPRSLLCKITGEDISFTEDVPDSAIWKVIISYLTEHPRRKRLPDVSSLDDVIRLLKSCNKIMVLTGAGVSVSCGIPDFRSRDGVYARLAQDFPDLPDPQAMFDIYYFRQNPKPFFKFAKEIFPGQFSPSPGHRFIKMLEKHNKLLRNYTQNIDTLEKIAGIDNVIECHGSFGTASCTKCDRQVAGDNIREEIFAQKIPTCSDCGPDGIMKPDIVFFGEGLPEKFHDAMAADKDSADLLIVIGSSLKVRPVALIPYSLPGNVPQILINRERLPHLDFDVELLGDCDVILDQLCYMLGEGWEEVRWRKTPLSDTTEFQHQPRHEYTSSEDEDYEEEEREVRCQRIGRRQGGVRDEEGVRHTSLDSSRDSGIGEASNSSTSLIQPIGETTLPRLDELPEPTEPVSSLSPLSDEKPSKILSSTNSEIQSSCCDSVHGSMSKPSPHPKVPKESFYRLGKRRYVFPGAELFDSTDSN